MSTTINIVAENIQSLTINGRSVDLSLYLPAEVVEPEPAIVKPTPVISRTRVIQSAREADFTASKVLWYSINGMPVYLRKYSHILHDLYELLRKEEILDISRLNVSGAVVDTRGYRWYPKLCVSIQRADTNKMVREILNVASFTGSAIKLFIRLRTGELVSLEPPIWR